MKTIVGDEEQIKIDTNAKVYDLILLQMRSTYMHELRNVSFLSWPFREGDIQTKFRFHIFRIRESLRLLLIGAFFPSRETE